MRSRRPTATDSKTIAQIPRSEVNTITRYADPIWRTGRKIGGLLPFTDTDSTVTPISCNELAHRPGDLVVHDGVISEGRVAVPDDPRTISALPAERMAAVETISTLPRLKMAGWEDLRAQMLAIEEGRSPQDVDMTPGGTLICRGPERDSRPVSRLSRERMAAPAVSTPRRGITYDDLQGVSQRDPDNVEQWKPIYGPLPGFTFRLNAYPFPSLPDFVFFVFRSAADGGLWRVAVLAPDMDAHFGHSSHILRVQLGTERRAILCGPGGRASRTLEEARLHAGKWKTYMAYKLAGHNPGFSL